MNYWRVLLVAWMALIFALSSWPGAARPETAEYLGSGNDPIRLSAHLVEFGILALLWLKALPARGQAASWRTYLLAFAFTVAYALSDELHQMYVPGRSFRWIHFAEDALGAVALLTGAWVIQCIHPTATAQPESS